MNREFLIEHFEVARSDCSNAARSQTTFPRNTAWHVHVQITDETAVRHFPAAHFLADLATSDGYCLCLVTTSYVDKRCGQGVWIRDKVSLLYRSVSLLIYVYTLERVLFGAPIDTYRYTQCDDNET
jgi:hypothetical protein